MSWHIEPVQLELLFEETAEAFRGRLARAGLGSDWMVTLTANRATMVSYRDHDVRIHHSYLGAPQHVVHAIVRFVTAYRGDARAAASRVILAHAPAHGAAGIIPFRRRERMHPRDEPWATRMTAAHREVNAERFGGSLRDITVRVSRRMRRKLGHYTVACGDEPAEIAISRWHIRNDSWSDVFHTLVHEMVHQWQDEMGLPVAHDRAFRRKAREVGIDPRATRVDDLSPVKTALRQ